MAPNTAQLTFRSGTQVLPLKPDPPLFNPGWLGTQTHDGQCGDRLARTALTDQSDRLLRAKVKGDVVNDHREAFVARETDTEALYPQQFMVVAQLSCISSLLS